MQLDLDDNLNGRMMDMLLAKKRSSDRKAWLERGKAIWRDCVLVVQKSHLDCHSGRNDCAMTIIRIHENDNNHLMNKEKLSMSESIASNSHDHDHDYRHHSSHDHDHSQDDGLAYSHKYVVPPASITLTRC